MGTKRTLLASAPRSVVEVARGSIIGSWRRRAALQSLRVVIFAVLLVVVAFPLAWWFGKSSSGIDPDTDTAWEFALFAYMGLLLLATFGGAMFDSATSDRSWPAIARWIAVAGLTALATPWFRALQVDEIDPLPSLGGWLGVALFGAALSALPVIVGAGMGSLIRRAARTNPVGADLLATQQPERPQE